MNAGDPVAGTGFHGPLATAVVGLGWWRSRIMGTLQQSSVLQPVVGVDFSERARMGAVERHGVATVATLDQALAQHDVDVRRL